MAAETVKVRVQNVHYEVIGNELRTSTSGFEMLEPDGSLPERTDNEPHHIAVEFDAQVPQVVVIHALRAILDSIERHGLPELVTEVEPVVFAALMKVQQRIAQMEPELRDAFGRIIKQQGETWIAPAEAEEGTVRMTKITKLRDPE